MAAASDGSKEAENKNINKYICCPAKKPPKTLVCGKCGGAYHMSCVARYKDITRIKGNLINCCDDDITSKGIQANDYAKKFNDLLLKYKQLNTEKEELKKECKNLSEQYKSLKQKEILGENASQHDTTIMEEENEDDDEDKGIYKLLR